jgi:type VI secretion system protein ImpH
LATESRSADPGLIKSEIEALLESQPFAFGFFQAVRLLERLSDGEAVGAFAPPASEAVRFGASASLTFPASEIHSISPRDERPPRMTVNFMGLTGPLGVLPLYYTEWIGARNKESDTGPADFLDIFNHRLISLFYRAWAKYRISVAREKADADEFSAHLKSLVGLGTAGLDDRQTLPDDSFIYYAGLLMRHGRSASDLKQIIADYFDVAVEIEEFAGSWYKLESDMQTRLDDADGNSSQLGMGAVAGDEMWQDESTVRIRLGPLSLDQYRDFLPGGEAHEALRGLTRFFSGDELDFEVQLVLRRDEAPRCVLGAEGPASPRLGWSTWVISTAFGREAADTILAL